MGYNTTVIVLNDALNAIARDPKFGEKLKNAALIVGTRQHDPMYRSGYGDVPAFGYVTAATVIESHHADTTAVVAVGGNRGLVLHRTSGVISEDLDAQERIVRELADKLGYTLTRKRQRNPTTLSKLLGGGIVSPPSDGEPK